MQTRWAVLIIAATSVAGCAARGSGAGVVTSPAAAVVHPGPRQSPAPGASQTVSPPDLWRRFAERLPAGAPIRIRTTSGERFTAMLLVVNETGITAMPKTRVPEAARHVPFDRIALLEPAPPSSVNVAKTAAISAGVGAATFIGLLTLLAATWD
jgi:hypothetical protein